MVNPEAYQAYLKGRFHWNNRTEGGLEAAIDYFNQTLEKFACFAIGRIGYQRIRIVFQILAIPFPFGRIHPQQSDSSIFAIPLGPKGVPIDHVDHLNSGLRTRFGNVHLLG